MNQLRVNINNLDVFWFPVVPPATACLKNVYFFLFYHLIKESNIFGVFFPLLVKGGLLDLSRMVEGKIKRDDAWLEDGSVSRAVSSNPYIYPQPHPTPKLILLPVLQNPATSSAVLSLKRKDQADATVT